MTTDADAQGTETQGTETHGADTQGPATDRAVTVHTPPPVPRSTLPTLSALLGLSIEPGDAAAAVQPAATAEPAHAAKPLSAATMTHVVDIGANPLEDTPPYLDLLRAGLVRVTGFEPQRDALQRLHAQAGPNETYLPDAMGDGTPRELHLCSSPGFSSLLEPDADQLAVLVDFADLGRVTDIETIPTTRLDDLAARGGLADAAGRSTIDLLKIDTQGSEPLIIEHGRRALADVLAVQIEVAFHRIYAGGPVLGEADLLLRDLGLVPHAFVSTRSWPLAPIPWADPLEASARHLVEADLLYVRDPATWAELPSDGVRRLCLLLVGAYGEVGTGLVLVRELIRRDELHASAETSYRELFAH